MKQDWLVDRLIALHAEHVQAHRRLLTALEANDLLGVVDAGRRQGQLCSEQGAALATYVASVVATMPDVDAAYRNQVAQLAAQLRAGQYEADPQNARGERERRLSTGPPASS